MSPGLFTAGSTRQKIVFFSNGIVTLEGIPSIARVFEKRKKRAKKKKKKNVDFVLPRPCHGAWGIELFSLPFQLLVW